MRFRSMSLLLALGATACTGSRHVERPTSPDGYQHIEVRDVGPMGLKDMNVEILGVLGPMVPQEVCDGLIQFPLIGGDASANPLEIMMMSSVTLTFPRSEYPRVRDYHPGDRVRVRGYISTWMAQGCDWFSRTTQRYVWVDTIERAEGEKPTKVQGNGQQGI